MTEEFPEFPAYSIASGALDYASLTTPFPLQVSPPSGDRPPARMDFVVSAPPGDPVRCAKVVMEIPIGTGATSLVETATGITATAPTGWQSAITSTASTATITFTPPGNAFVFDQDGVEIVIDGLRINTEPGNVTIRIAEHLVGEPQPTVVPLFVEKWPYRPPVLAGSPNRFAARRWAGTGSLSPSPATQVTAGQRVTLTWQARGDVERHLFTQPLNDDLGATGRDVSTLTRFDCDPVVRPTTFTLRTKVKATGETMYDTVTVTVDTPTFAGLSLTAPLAAGASGTVTFPEAVTVTKGLSIDGELTAGAGLTALATFEAKQNLNATTGISVTGSAGAGGTSTVPGGEVTAAGITTKDLTAKKTVRIFNSVVRISRPQDFPGTDRLLVGYMVQGVGVPNPGMVTVTVGNREVGARGRSLSSADSLFLAVRGDEAVTYDPSTISSTTMFLAWAILGSPTSS
ncbi:hypothetical protein ACIGXM_11810 [Kitasatospora sp. NPDC052896]|uniref:hypothetical protein n=1 Tax=Kitasatospora sp. NPDC052896 TaxID=3364061 RepID=UPI0037C579AB